MPRLPKPDRRNIMLNLVAEDIDWFELTYGKKRLSDWVSSKLSAHRKAKEKGGKNIGF